VTTHDYRDLVMVESTLFFKLLRNPLGGVLNAAIVMVVSGLL